jgi:GNAT superfamily N-acetyltransferase
VTKKRLHKSSLKLYTPDDGDIPALNRLFSDAFTDRYRRDGLIGVRVPELNPDIWRYALSDAAEGAMTWSDRSGDLIAFNIAHHSGTEGWMGPLAVRSDTQEAGVGRLIVQTAIEWLRDAGAATIGLETMPRTVDNIGFYSRLGFVPRHLTVTMTHEARRGSLAAGFIRLAALSQAERDELLERCRQRLQRSAPGCDYTREFQLTVDLGIGDAVVLEDAGAVRAFALWHSVPLARDRSMEDLRVLKLFADSQSAFEELLGAIEKCASRLGLTHISVRCQTAFRWAYQTLIQRGYRVRWTDLRMTLDEFAEARIPVGEVLLSNWEI